MLLLEFFVSARRVYRSDIVSSSKKYGKRITCQSSIAGRLQGCTAEVAGAGAGGGMTLCRAAGPNVASKD